MTIGGENGQARLLLYGNFVFERFLKISQFCKMSSLESCYRGALAATPDRSGDVLSIEMFLCKSAGGEKGKRNPGKAILAGKG